MSMSFRDEQQLQRMYGLRKTKQLRLAIKHGKVEALIWLMDKTCLHATNVRTRLRTLRVFVNILENFLKSRSAQEKETLGKKLAEYRRMIGKLRRKCSGISSRRHWDSSYYLYRGGMHGATPRRFQKRGSLLGRTKRKQGTTKLRVHRILLN